MDGVGEYFDVDFFQACAVEITVVIAGCDQAPVMPLPISIWLVMQMSDAAVKQAWLKAYCK